MSGDGPAYDHADMVARQRHAHEVEQRRKRRDALLGMMRTTGFGPTSDVEFLELEATRHLTSAFKLLDTLVIMDVLLAERSRGGKS